MTEISGYSHPQYAASLVEFGLPRELAKCGGWILEREISGTSFYDAMGCYPLFLCNDWSKLAADINDLDDKLISLSMVTDPFADISPEKLADIFDIFIKFKEHYITDLSQPLELSIRERTIRYAKSALHIVSVEHIKEPIAYLSEWIQLYNVLIQRHSISGLRAFSEQSFRLLLSLPGVEMFIARLGEEIIGAETWMVSNNIGYAHLIAMSPLGYEHRASYALTWVAMQYFSKRLHWLDHGSAAGLKMDDNGLVKFKRGWATETRQAFFCGKIINRAKYKEITMEKGCNNSDFFPAYRDGEYY